MLPCGCSGRACLRSVVETCTSITLTSFLGPRRSERHASLPEFTNVFSRKFVLRRSTAPLLHCTLRHRPPRGSHELHQGYRFIDPKVAAPIKGSVWVPEFQPPVLSRDFAHTWCRPRFRAIWAWVRPSFNKAEI
jgi:hypothetical protein